MERTIQPGTLITYIHPLSGKEVEDLVLSITWTGLLEVDRPHWHSQSRLTIHPSQVISYTNQIEM